MAKPRKPARASLSTSSAISTTWVPAIAFTARWSLLFETRIIGCSLGPVYVEVVFMGDYPQMSRTNGGLWLIFSVSTRVRANPIAPNADLKCVFSPIACASVAPRADLPDCSQHQGGHGAA